MYLYVCELDKLMYNMPIVTDEGTDASFIRYNLSSHGLPLHSISFFFFFCYFIFFPSFFVLATTSDVKNIIIPRFVRRHLLRTNNKQSQPVVHFIVYQNTFFQKKTA